MARPRAYGADARLIAAFETNYGVAPNDGYVLLPFESDASGGEKPLGYEPEAGMGNQAQDPFYGPTGVAGDIVIHQDIAYLGWWLKGLFGVPVTTDNMDGTWTHVFTAGADVPSLTFELGHTNLASPKYYRRLGAKLGDFRVELSREGYAKATMAVLAQNETLEAATLEADPDTYTRRKIMGRHASVLVDGVGKPMTGGSLAYSNNLEGIEALRNDGLIEAADETERTAEGTLEMRLSTDDTLLDAIEAETPLPLTIAHTLPGSPAQSVTWAFPRVFYSLKTPPVQGPGGVAATVNWRASSTGEPHLVEVTLVNEVEDYS